MIIQKEENHGDYLAARRHPQQNRKFGKSKSARLIAVTPCLLKKSVYVSSDEWLELTARVEHYLMRSAYEACNIHGKKFMLCIWRNQLGMVYYELLSPSETMTGTLYRTQLMRLNRALKEKRAQYYSRHDKILLLHDNARPHVAIPVKNYLKTLDWEVLTHPPYSSNTAPSDYHLFWSMAHALSEQRFTSYEDTKNWVDTWIASKDKEFFRLGIRTLPERWQKVVASDGQYFD
ncbi:Mariner Mos1 transposase [Eumeta japonica]|uniref:Mariner Mos1 transposase n=1 Tax=Eumeta variegata TaxID=151549 RepID=A0A4C1UU41_EUMVA|nr:Mariner Mos1 transposase [Eumeta japonica]